MATRATPLLSRAAALVLAVSGGMGFFVGAVLEPTWQDVIEPGQVLAGIVHYAQGNPVFLYSTHTWALLHQVSALLLLAGFSERALAILLSGMVGLVSFQALGMTIFALSEDVAVACAAPFFVFFTAATWGGIAYPVMLVGAPYTSGIIGLSYLLLVCALFGAGEYACGLLLLGLMPAVHVTLSVWCLLMVGLSFWFGGRAETNELWRARGWLIAGVVLSGLSAAVHFARLAPTVTLTPEDGARYLSAVMSYWDAHRRPFARLSIQQVPFLLGTIVAGVWLRRMRGTRAAPFLLRALLVSAAIGTALSLVLIVDPWLARGLLWKAMPSRLMNLPLLACMAMVIGVAARSKTSVRSRGTLAGLVVVLSIVAAMTDLAGSRIALMAKISYAVMALAALILAIPERPRRAGDATNLPADRMLPALRLLTIGSLVLLFGVAAILGRSRFAGEVDPQEDWRIDAPRTVFEAAAARPGMLLTASKIHLVQLRTRRPVLLDGGAIDALAYVPVAAPETERILRDVYGIALLAPPFPAKSADGSLPTDAGRSLWESRTPGEWAALGERFGITDVLTFADWRLQLPRVANDRDFVLYALGSERR